MSWFDIIYLYMACILFGALVGAGVMCIIMDRREKRLIDRLKDKGVIK